MDSANNGAAGPAFYTVPETARILRVTPATIYRAIREDAFPAVRIRTRHVIPASAVDRLASEAAESGGCVDVAAMAAQRSRGGPRHRRCAVVNHDDTPDYEAMATGLDHWRQVPTEVLRDVVMRRGLCLWGLWPEVEPDWDDCASSDREVAAWLCAGCPVIDQCLELDLRTSGACTTGVWGALPEDDRRALHPIWQRRHQYDGSGQEGEPRS